MLENSKFFLDASENDEDTTTHSGLNYINRIIRPLAYPRYGCYTEKNAKMHTYSRYTMIHCLIFYSFCHSVTTALSPILHHCEVYSVTYHLVN